MMKIKRGEFWFTIFFSVGRTVGRSNFHGEIWGNGNHEFSGCAIARILRYSCGAFQQPRKSIAIWSQQKVIIRVVTVSMRLVGGYMFRGKWFDLMRLMWCLRTNTVASPFGHPRLCHLQVRFAIILEEVCPSSA